MYSSAVRTPIPTINVKYPPTSSPVSDVISADPPNQYPVVSVNRAENEIPSCTICQR
ncbi:uncharacterized protein PGTG_02961 [Puccinia graminis f. sp. tritici CRL 75-36-700-3]|uniref:Uncharacterized protein n=1 Tax=Puccinia graminis f. sp. tritici (strain CRL 75-36-700-3 / race SCCL) TaxID=418459 RepID=E3JWU5_PUCGT|nr:uncharacterized protein PGTG_02961 [Puccinia graminis f. sp. tritici CRL 75-36-700-3]EFP76520.2 hypothetical protein PGTG_02961 [Puccinia graminis f. sp. tritici CRL 75-36-700-3]